MIFAMISQYIIVFTMRKIIMSKSTPSIQVIERAANLLQAITANAESASLKILAAETGLHPSTAFRILASLIQVGWVERDTNGHYYIGHQVRKLASSMQRGGDLREEARSVMEQLCAEIGETINLTVREGDEVIYIERVSPKRMMRVEQVIGSRAPLHVTAVGKLMLGELGQAFIRAYSKRTGLKAYTQYTHSSLEQLLPEVARATADAYAYDNQEAEIGVGCIGVLIYNKAEEVVAGLSISAPIERRRDEWIALLQQAAASISSRLG